MMSSDVPSPGEPPPSNIGAAAHSYDRARSDETAILDIGEVVRTMASFLREHGLFAFGVSFILLAPESIYNLVRAFILDHDWDAITRWLDGVGEMPSFVGNLLGTTATLTLAFAVHSFRRHEEWSPKSAISQGFGAIGRGVVMQIVVTLAVVVGLLVFVVPGVIVAVATTIALPLVALEKRPTFDAFNRCFALTKGHRWRIGTLFFVILLLPLCIYLIGYFGTFPADDDLTATEADWLIRIRITAVAEVVFGSVMTTVAGVLSATIYTLLVRSEEVTDTRAMQEIFE